MRNKENHINERAVRTTIQTLYDKGLFDNYENADQVMKEYLLVEVNDRRRPEIDEVNDVIQRFCS